MKQQLSVAQKRDCVSGWLDTALEISKTDIAIEAMKEQLKYVPWLTIDIAHKAVNKVLSKDDFLDCWLLAIELDSRANEWDMEIMGLNTMLMDDHPGFGTDELLALAAAGLYGPIATSNFGHLDKNKVGIVGKVNDLGKQEDGICTTMSDDMVAATIAAAEAYIAKNEMDLLTETATKLPEKEEAHFW